MSDHDIRLVQARFGEVFTSGASQRTFAGDVSYPSWLVIAFAISGSVVILAALSLMVTPFFGNLIAQIVCVAALALGLFVVSAIVKQASDIRERR